MAVHACCREIASLSLDNVDLPDNHPFATKQRVSQEEERLQAERLKVQRGLPLQDLAGALSSPHAAHVCSACSKRASGTLPACCCAARSCPTSIDCREPKGAALHIQGELASLDTGGGVFCR